MGEVWVTAPHTAVGYSSLIGAAPPPGTTNEEAATLPARDGGVEGDGDHFTARLTTGDKEVQFARTGYLGFVRRTELTQSNGGIINALLMFIIFFMIFIYFQPKHIIHNIQFL